MHGLLRTETVQKSTPCPKGIEVIGHVASRGDFFRDGIAKLQDRGCDPVALSCTEIPLLISEKDSSLPILDSTRILARAALAGSRESIGTINCDSADQIPSGIRLYNYYDIQYDHA